MNSLSHLPEQKQKEILHIVGIIKEVINPEMIILYGSHAKGKQVDNIYTSKGVNYEYVSDYDFLIVTNENPERVYAYEAKIVDLCDNIKPSLNLEIHEIDYINKGLEIGEYFFVEILKDGIELYNSNKLKFALPKKLTLKEFKEISKRYYQNWFPQAEDFLETAIFLKEKGSYKLSAFQLHQAAESLFNTILLVFTHYKPKIHNLQKLRIRSKNISPELYNIFDTENDVQDKILFEKLKRGYIDSRYRLDYQISEIEVLKLISKVSKMIIIVKDKCSEILNN
ncbi:HEPN domain-containing protein [Polluticaenibacter yanchengensis]|uniref:HEPN domain-containing protein n=1 Tax=Polluticaenibacter yanchengensis TaxID=3014562 RepID=A0ABT4UM75_9BACT|nr:HEPN domain-containing protein [Chitinophagaceae bacterium LY-5]